MPISATLTCGGGEHRVVADGDRLTLLDHDELAQETLVRLGDDVPVPECVEVLRSWNDCFDLPELQIALGELAGVRPGDEHFAFRKAAAIATVDRYRGILRSPLPDHVPTRPYERLARRAARALGVLLMPSVLREALGVAVADTSVADVRDDRADVVAIGMSTAQSVGRSIVTSLASHLATPSDDRVARALLGAAADASRRSGRRGVGYYGELFDIGLTMTEADQRHVDGRWSGERLTAEVVLPERWIPTVAARGLCWEHLVLEVVEESDDHRRVLVRAARWSGDELRVEPAEMTYSEAPIAHPLAALHDEATEHGNDPRPLPGMWSTRW